MLTHSELIAAVLTAIWVRLGSSKVEPRAGAQKTMRSPLAIWQATWVDWMPVFSAITTFIDALGQPGLDDAPEQVQSIQLRQALDSAMPALSRAGLAESLTASRKLTGTQLIDAIHEDLNKLEHTLEASL